jgi:hypothetical protein
LAGAFLLRDMRIQLRQKCWGGANTTSVGDLMIERIEQAAQLSVARACGFAAIAIVTFMIGFASSPALCFKSGGIMMLMTTAVLLLKASWVAKQPYKTTEVWLLLRQEDRPNEATAQQIISGVLRDIYLTFARITAGLAAFMLGLSFTILLFGGSTQMT